MPRVRRPLIALVALVAALAIGYGVRAAHHDAHHPPAAPSTVTTTSTAH